MDNRPDASYRFSTIPVAVRSHFGCFVNTKNLQLSRFIGPSFRNVPNSLYLCSFSSLCKVNVIVLRHSKCILQGGENLMYLEEECSEAKDNVKGLETIIFGGIAEIPYKRSEPLKGFPCRVRQISISDTYLHFFLGCSTDPAELSVSGISAEQKKYIRISIKDLVFVF